MQMLCSAPPVVGPNPLPDFNHVVPAMEGVDCMLLPRSIHLCRDELVNGWGQVSFCRWSREGHVQPAVPQRAEQVTLGVLCTGTELQLIGLRAVLPVWHAAQHHQMYVCGRMNNTQACFERKGWG